jgi:hypothetical protein
LSELRVVIPHLQNQPLVVRERTVQLDDEGLTEPLTAAEHAYLTSIPAFLCADTYRGADCPVCRAEPDLSGETLLDAVVDTFDGEVITPPSLADFAEKVYGAAGEEEEQLRDLPDAWLDMDETERAETVRDLEDFGAQEAVFLYLFDYEAALLNNPTVLTAIDTALGHLRPVRSTTQINEALVRQSAAGKVKTKNPPSPKRGK